eukprot:gnl/MRDRNA2_/MRDRNA2_105810_c0_seq1.p1 gnl/MRDRNA2_/MRDRNA2_105810_c0~~gnl/MRDRNA2_/MRDRNA2_105810_c0_seq1.p1  ORF type:complete len:344 (-),score=58.44 gnl/MRDRNA2_/MRDRNA2_105810_c0_seq1:83-1039(-)
MAPVLELDTARYGSCMDLKVHHFGKYVAVAYDDHIIRIFESEKGQVVATLRGHHAPVSSVSWSHPNFGNMLLSGGDDQFSFVWRERGPGDWHSIYQKEVRAPITAVVFAPYEYGLWFAIASADGDVTVVRHRDGKISSSAPGVDGWTSKMFQAHDGGVLGLDWAPSLSPVMLASGPAARAPLLASKRLVTSGEDKLIKIWRHDGEWDSWTTVQQLDGVHSASVIDVAWRPSVGIPCNMIASCAEDGSVAIWIQDMEGQPWRLRSQWQFDGVDARQIAWSHAGQILSVSVGENGAVLYRECLDGAWEQVSALKDGSIEN